MDILIVVLISTICGVAIMTFFENAYIEGLEIKPLPSFFITFAVVFVLGMYFKPSDEIGEKGYNQLISFKQRINSIKKDTLTDRPEIFNHTFDDTNVNIVINSSYDIDIISEELKKLKTDDVREDDIDNLIETLREISERNEKYIESTRLEKAKDKWLGKANE